MTPDERRAIARDYNDLPAEPTRTDALNTVRGLATRPGFDDATRLVAIRAYVESALSAPQEEASQSFAHGEAFSRVGHLIESRRTDRTPNSNGLDYNTGWNDALDTIERDLGGSTNPNP